MWENIQEGLWKPTKRVEGEFVRVEWTQDDIKKFQLNYKAINTLHCALNTTEFNRVSTCTTAKEISEELKVTHEEPDEETEIQGRRRNRLYKRNFKKDKFKSKVRKQNQLICYKCREPGHTKTDCPLNSTEDQKKKKAMMASAWSDSDTSSVEASDVEEDIKANLCLTVKEDEPEVMNNPLISFDDLQSEFDNLYYDFEKFTSKYKTLKKMNPGLMNDLECLKKELTSMQESKDTLQNVLRHVIEENEKFEHELNELKIVSSNVTSSSGSNRFNSNRNQKNFRLRAMVEHEHNGEGVMAQPQEKKLCQLCDKGWRVTFDSRSCQRNDINTNKLIFIGKRHRNVYIVYLDDLQLSKNVCLMVRSSFKSKNIDSTTRALELLHLDLFGPIDVTSMVVKSLDFVIVDDKDEAIDFL
ncbi:Zinc finger, CCHC-type [Corchorus capsularis]|uniref:Zinc finger, CCHC-type n=1 Tax=Corchorus capsularis TaxID=210143 RepID=A0A1R3JS69_COCAP|nr:Zinc finger, CCHC-type [Corchorus capsularis]